MVPRKDRRSWRFFYVCSYVQCLERRIKSRSPVLKADEEILGESTRANMSLVQASTAFLKIGVANRIETTHRALVRLDLPG